MKINISIFFLINIIKVSLKPLLFDLQPQLDEHSKFLNLIEISERVKNISTQNNSEFIIELGIGTPKKLFTFFLDTNVNYLVIPSQNDTQRNTNKFNSSNSKTFHDLKSKKNLSFSFADIEGNFVRDSIIFDSEVVLESFKFLLIQNENSLDNLQSDGILGLNLPNGDFESNFIYQLYSEEFINSPQFSFFFSDLTSKFIIGKLSNFVELTLISKKMRGCDLIDTVSWSCNGTSILIGNNTFLISSTVKFDSGVSKLIIPEKDFNLIQSDFLGNSSCGINQENQLLCECEQKSDFTKNISLKFGNSLFNIDINELVKFNNESQFKCQFDILININEGNTWVLGRSTWKNKILNFNSKSRKVKFIETDFPERLTWINHGLGFWKWLMLILVLIMVLLLISYIIYRCCKGNNNQEEELKNE